MALQGVPFFLSFHSSHKLLENQNGKSDSSYRLLKQIPLSACGVTPAPKARLLGPSACSISQNKIFLIVIVQEDSFERALQEFTLLLAFLGLIATLKPQALYSLCWISLASDKKQNIMWSIGLPTFTPQDLVKGLILPPAKCFQLSVVGEIRALNARLSLSGSYLWYDPVLFQLHFLMRCILLVQPCWNSTVLEMILTSP